MSDNFVQQGSNTTNTGSVSVTLTGVVAGSALVAFAFDGTTTTPGSPAVSDAQGSYTAQGSALTDSPNLVWGQSFTLVNANAGSHTVTFSVTGADAVFLCVVEVGSTAGTSAVSGVNQAFQATPAAGANTLSSGSVTVSAASTLIGFSTDTASITASDEPTTGTSPIAFTSRSSGTSNGAGAWRLETAGASSNAAATAGPVTTSHSFMTFGVAILNAASSGTNATPGTWSWAGTTATTTQLINASVGAWSWSGTTATTTQLILATPATYTWAGATATTTQLLNASVGTWSWAGTTASLGSALLASLGTWSWTGTVSGITQLINATPGSWNWGGVNSSVGPPITIHKHTGQKQEDPSRLVKIQNQNLMLIAASIVDLLE